MATNIDIGTTWIQVIWKKEEREKEKRNTEMSVMAVQVDFLNSK